jgi:hypothetical protein
VRSIEEIREAEEMLRVSVISALVIGQFGGGDECCVHARGVVLGDGR